MNILRGASVHNLISLNPAHEAQFLMLDIAKSATPETALAAPKMFQIKKTLGEQDLTKLVVFVLKNFCDSLNVKEPMNALQLLDTANAFIDTYTHASAEDLILCLKNAKAGKYGPIYNRVDQSVILGFYAKYEQEKSEYLETRNHKVREASDVMGIFKHLPDETRQRLLHKSPETLPVEDEENNSPLYDENEYKALITDWMRTATVEELEGGIRYYMGKGSKEYITLLEKELLSRRA